MPINTSVFSCLPIRGTQWGLGNGISGREQKVFSHGGIGYNVRSLGYRMDVLTFTVLGYTDA